MMMKTLAQEFAQERVRVNAISPGAIRTAINEEETEGEAGKELLKLIPYGRIGAAEDVANAAVWLASDLADYMVGATLYVDGGMTLYPEFRGNG
nr:SDR family oxidoreductase [Chenggangzhangella methanolivorans]